MTHLEGIRKIDQQNSLVLFEWALINLLVNQDHVTGYAKDVGLSLRVIAVPEFEGPDEVAMEKFILYCNQIRNNKEVTDFFSFVSITARGGKFRTYDV
jgi:hypothetical protein